MKKILYILTVIALPFFAFSQNVEFEKKNFPDKKDELREAIAAIREGDAIIDMGEERLFMAALPYYLKAQAFNPNNDKVNFMIAVCYLSKNSH